MIEEKDLNERLLKLIIEIFKDKSLLVDIKENQKQYSDKNVYHNVDSELKKIIYEKN